VAVQSGGTLAPGNSGIGTLTISNNITLSGTNLMKLNRTNAPNADLLVAPSLPFGGTLTVVNSGPALQGNDTFHLFSGSISGSFAATNLPTLSSPDLSWDASLLQSQGIIKVVSSLPSNPTNISFTVSGGTLSLTWPGSYLGWIAQSNSISLSSTNSWFDIAGSQSQTNLSIPINSSLTNVFYRLRHP
jgi:hypothetical protein